jgi:hypothetical protein
MADVTAYGRYCGIRPSQIPVAPEALSDPKATILGWVAGGQAPKLARYVESGRRRAIPDWAILGEWHAEFAAHKWNPHRAVRGGRAPSLMRALNRLKTVVAST